MHPVLCDEIIKNLYTTYTGCVTSAVPLLLGYRFLLIPMRTTYVSRKLLILSRQISGKPKNIIAILSVQHYAIDEGTLFVTVGYTAWASANTIE